MSTTNMNVEQIAVYMAQTLYTDAQTDLVAQNKQLQNNMQKKQKVRELMNKLAKVKASFEAGEMPMHDTIDLLKQGQATFKGTALEEGFKHKNLPKDARDNNGKSGYWYNSKGSDGPRNTAWKNWFEEKERELKAESDRLSDIGQLQKNDMQRALSIARSNEKLLADLGQGKNRTAEHVSGKISG